MGAAWGQVRPWAMPAKRKPRQKKSQGDREREALASRRGRGPEWWEKHLATPEGKATLEEAQARGRQLVEGGCEAVALAQLLAT